MGLFSRKPKSRRDIAQAADRARARGRLEKAAAGYRRLLVEQPSDPSTSLKLGEVLARMGDEDGAAACFRAAAQRHLAAGFTDRASAVVTTAVEALPLSIEFRQESARLQILRGRGADALKVLVAGGEALARARRRPEAIGLLRRAREIEPWHLETVLLLARLLARTGEREEARALCAGLEARVRGPALRRARWLSFRLSPGLRTFWRWLRAG
ncbi:MAG: tetratricopeptide repeat protein [Deltaproteobacteria bacterium]|nr:tetratricopeptide repeat protein [Deltaproteobacteria bacterium]